MPNPEQPKMRPQLLHDLALSLGGLRLEGPARPPRVESIADMRPSLMEDIASSLMPVVSLPSIPQDLDEDSDSVCPAEIY
jgi:hypothetical protein